MYLNCRMQPWIGKLQSLLCQTQGLFAACNVYVAQYDNWHWAVFHCCKKNSSSRNFRVLYPSQEGMIVTSAMRPYRWIFEDVVILACEFGNITFRPIDFSPRGHFAPSLDVSPPDISPQDISPPGRFDPDCGRFAPSAFLCVCCFLEHRNVTDGWTDRIAINILHKCGDMQ